jgi:hypothetical protein
VKALRVRVLRREAALVAAALLLPIPLLALSGLTVPLPGVVERSLGSLVTLDTDRDGSSGTERAGSPSSGQSSVASRAEAPSSGDDSRSIAPVGRASGAALDRDVRPAIVAAGDEIGSRDPGGDDGGGGTPPGGGSEGASAEPGSPGAGPGASGGHTSFGSADDVEADATPEPQVSVSVAGQGTASRISAGTSGLDLEAGAEDGPPGEETEVGVAVAGEDGSRVGVEATLPAPGSALP